MTASIRKTKEEIKELPLVELAYELLRTGSEPMYFRDIMSAIQKLRGMKEDEALEVIARLYTEINVDGRFICIGQNVWGLRSWYPVDNKVNDRPSTKKFIRNTGDAFSDDDELDDYDEEETADVKALGEDDEATKSKRKVPDDEDTPDDDSDDDFDDDDDDGDAEVFEEGDADFAEEESLDELEEEEAENDDDDEDESV